MSIPQLTCHGILPEGVHSCAGVDFQHAFATNDRREELHTKLLRFLNWLKTKNITVIEFYADGSYTTSKTAPSDIDLVLDIDGLPGSAAVEAFKLWQSERAYIKAEFEVDYWVTFSGAPRRLEEFFQYIKPQEAADRGLQSGDRKGILKVII